MIYITGDCHSEFHKLNKESFPEQKEMTKRDCVIICGDFGGIWDWEGESAREKWWLNWLEERSFTVLFVDGNHENFERLAGYPKEEWSGGLVHVIRPHVLHLMRGEVFIVDGCRIFAFGGARSHDIDGGILEIDDPDFKRKQRQLEEDCTPYRINHRSWWKEEMPDQLEMQHGIVQLQKYKNQVDYIVTHDCPASTLAILGSGFYKVDELSRYLEEVRIATQYKR